MAEAHPNPFVHHLRHLLGDVPAPALTDGQLLERFLADRDETAVEMLVRRYGPLVFGACRRVLRNAHAAEDAFQATFLVLVRKAPALDRGQPLGSWLYTVAYRLALRARANELRRQQCEGQVARQRFPAPGRDPGSSDLAVALEEELHRLPERHRAALVLCYLEGKTNEQAAEILGCPRGSMAARLTQARERLRQCLVRRGFTAPAAGIAAALATATAPAAVPLPLLDNTARAALWFARGEAGAATFVSARAVALARGACRALFLNRLKIAGALLLIAGLLGTGATMLLKAAPQAGPPAPAGDPAPLEARPQRAETPGRGANAAVAYGQAFLALRRGLRPVGENKLVADSLTLPLDADARAVVTRAGYALRMLRRGAALPRCDWVLDPGQGIDVSFRHGEGARVLSALACLRARLRFEEGQNAEALDDILAALTLARHVERDGTLDSLWAGYQVEQRLGKALALYLPRLDARTVKDLQTRLDSLPSGGSAAQATLRMEEAMLDWIAGEVREAKDGERLLDFLSQLGTGPREPEKRRAEGRGLLAACGGTAAGVLRFGEEMRRHAAPLAQTLNLPPDQVDRALRREEKKLAANPVFRVFAPVLHKVRVLQARADVRRALLAAVLALRLDGPAALKQHPDPVVGGPFERVGAEGGFELRSKCNLDETWHVPLEPPDDEPLALRVGRHGG